MLLTTVYSITAEVPYLDENTFRRDDFVKVARGHLKFKNTLEESIKNIRKVDKMIENDLEEHFQTWIPMSNNMYLNANF